MQRCSGIIFMQLEVATRFNGSTDTEKPATPQTEVGHCNTVGDVLWNGWENHGANGSNWDCPERWSPNITPCTHMAGLWCAFIHRGCSKATERDDRCFVGWNFTTSAVLPLISHISTVLDCHEEETGLTQEIKGGIKSDLISLYEKMICSCLA